MVGEWDSATTAAPIYAGPVFLLGSNNDVTASALPNPFDWASGDYKKGKLEHKLGADILKLSFRLVTHNVVRKDKPRLHRHIEELLEASRVMC